MNTTDYKAAKLKSIKEGAIQAALNCLEAEDVRISVDFNPLHKYYLDIISQTSLTISSALFGPRYA